MLNTATTSSAESIPTRDPDQLLAIIDELHKHNDLLRQKVYYLTHKRFGASSEKISDSQQSLFDTTQIDTTDEPIDATREDIDVTSHKRARRNRQDVFAGLPVERIEIDLTDEEKVCDCCGGDLHRIGEDTHREIEFKPAILNVKEIVHVKYGCRQCEIGVKRAAIAPRLLPKSFASISLLVHLIISKYADHLPLYRIEQQFKRLGFILPRSTQSEWLMQIAEKCQPLIPLMADTIRAGPRIWTDDTVLPLANDDPNRDRTIQARLWSYIGGDIDEPNTIVYEFTRTRKLAGPAAWLKDYRGYLIADAYPGYDHLFLSGEIKEIACWAHCRRYFYTATLGIKTETRAHWVIKLIGKLAAIEKTVKSLPMEQRHYYRRRHAKPITQSLYQWMQNNASAVSRGSVLAKALHYMNNNWLALTRYVTQDYLPLTNNTAEQTMRPIAIGRKNYLCVSRRRIYDENVMLTT